MGSLETSLYYVLDHKNCSNGNKKMKNLLRTFIPTRKY